MTATPKPVLRDITTRDGHRSVWTGNDSDTLVPQHRQGGMGGRRNKHQLSNVVWLESDINGLIESDPAMAAEARLRGIKISVHATDPSEVPIVHAVHGLVTLTNNVNDEHGGVKRIIHTRKEH